MHSVEYAVARCLKSVRPSVRLSVTQLSAPSDLLLGAGYK